MKIKFYLIIAVLLVFNTITGCNAETAGNKNVSKMTDPKLSSPAPVGFSGAVIETMNSGGYTYVKIDTGSEKIWAAATEFQVKVGDKVTFAQGVPMKNYHSKTLERTFELVYFVSDISVPGSDKASSMSQKGVTGSPHGDTVSNAPAKIDFSGIKKPKGGKTVAEVYAEKDNLSGKEVIVRGKVVKFSRNIMGKNWIHLQDGTGDKGTNDLTITTSTMSKEGDTVLARGVLVTNKDFGSGYKYDLIIEDANVTIE